MGFMEFLLWLWWLVSAGAGFACVGAAKSDIQIILAGIFWISATVAFGAAGCMSALRSLQAAVEAKPKP